MVKNFCQGSARLAQKETVTSTVLLWAVYGWSKIA